MNGELLAILGAIERDKGIDREILIQAIEVAVAAAARKSVGASEEASSTATLDRQTGRIMAVVDGRAIVSSQLSRIAAQAAKQVIMQKIREAERDIIFTEFQGRIGDIVTGSVHRFERGDIVVELGRTEALLPKSERIPHEEYHQGDLLQGYVLDVSRGGKGPAITLSRTHEGFLRGLFSLEVPEISQGVVQIRGLSREAGDRTKIAVSSMDERVDAVGACVGMRGTRVKNIVRELHGEKVDIIRWHEAADAFISAALAPAKVGQIQLNEETRQAVVLVDDDQLSLAIGKKGQNVRLASRLTGWQLEIKTQGQVAQPALSLQDLRGVGPTIEARLLAAGVTTVAQLAALTLEQLVAIEGVGEKTAQRLWNAARAVLASAPSAPSPAVAVSEPVEPPQQDAAVEQPVDAPTDVAAPSSVVAPAAEIAQPSGDSHEVR